MKQKNLQKPASKSIDYILDSINPIEQAKVGAKLILAANFQDASQKGNCLRNVFQPFIAIGTKKLK